MVGNMMIEAGKQYARNVVGPYAADRRTDPRYKFGTEAELFEDESGKRIATRVDDLSRRGCHLSTPKPSPVNTTASVRIRKGTESFEANARVVSSIIGNGMGLLFTEVAPKQNLILTEWLMGSLENSWRDSSRRRSRRVLMRIPVRVCGKDNIGLQFEEETRTETLSPHGALIFLWTNVIKGQPITLSNSPPKGAVQ